MDSVILGGIVPLGADVDDTFLGLECHCLGKGIAGTATEE